MLNEPAGQVQIAFPPEQRWRGEDDTVRFPARVLYPDRQAEIAVECCVSLGQLTQYCPGAWARHVPAGATWTPEQALAVFTESRGRIERAARAFLDRHRPSGPGPYQIPHAYLFRASPD